VNELKLPNQCDVALTTASRTYNADQDMEFKMKRSSAWTPGSLYYLAVQHKEKELFSQ